MTRGLDAERGVICHQGVSDGSAGAHPLSRSHSARTEMFSADEYCKDSLQYDGQVQDFQNIMKYVLSQVSLLNLVSWPTPDSF